MKMNFTIVTDTGANLPENIIEENDILVLSLSFFVDDKEYYSYEPGKKTDLSEFYKMMRCMLDFLLGLVERFNPFLLRWRN